MRARHVRNEIAIRLPDGEHASFDQGNDELIDSEEKHNAEFRLIED